MNDAFERNKQISQERHEAEKKRRKEAVAARDAALKARPMESKAKVVARAGRYQDVAFQIVRALKEGKMFFWKGSENHLIDIAADMGLTLITESRAKKAGFVLKKGQQPVGSVYFGAPISREAEVYVLECQFNRGTEK